MCDTASTEKSRWLQAVFKRYSGPALRYTLKLTGDSERAREIVQEAFLKLCEEDEKKLEDRVAQWLFTVCRNAAITSRKKDGRMVLKIVEESTPGRADDLPLSKLEAKRKASLLLRLLQTLPKNQREVIVLKFQNGFSYKEIGEITGLSVSNVGFLMHSGLKTLRNEYNKTDGELKTAGGVQ